jgi:uncharacterized membrane protein
VYILILNNYGVFEVLGSLDKSVYSESIAGLLSLIVAILFTFDTANEFSITHRKLNNALCIFFFGLFGVSHLFVNSIVNHLNQESYTKKIQEVDKRLHEIESIITR